MRFDCGSLSVAAFSVCFVRCPAAWAHRSSKRRSEAISVRCGSTRRTRRTRLLRRRSKMMLLWLLQRMTALHRLLLQHPVARALELALALMPQATTRLSPPRPPRAQLSVRRARPAVRRNAVRARTKAAHRSPQYLTSERHARDCSTQQSPAQRGKACARNVHTNSFFSVQHSAQSNNLNTCRKRSFKTKSSRIGVEQWALREKINFELRPARLQALALASASLALLLHRWHSARVSLLLLSQ